MARNHPAFSPTCAVVLSGALIASTILEAVKDSCLAEELGWVLGDGIRNYLITAA
jgi:hypothetical protein